jgi:protein TonB
MFDAVLGRAGATRGRLGTGAALSLSAHAAILAAAIALSVQPAAQAPDDDYEFVFVPPPPPVPPAAPLAAGVEAPAQPTAKPRPIARDDTIYDSHDPPKDAPPAPSPEETQGSAAGVEGGSPDGDKNGVTGGMFGGDSTATRNDRPPVAAPPRPTTVVIPFGSGMTRPSRVAGRDPVYTREAREARIEGIALARCVIQVDGVVGSCRMIKTLPHMDKAILDALSTWRMTPVIHQGRPIAVDYVITVRLVLR